MTTAITDKVSIPQGVFGIDLNFTVYNNDKTVHDLTSYDTVKFQVWEANVPGTLIVDGTCTGAAADGTCTYAIVNTDFTTVGRYLWHIEMIKAGYEDHTDAGQLVVLESA